MPDWPHALDVTLEITSVLEIMQFVLGSFWHFVGAVILLYIPVQGAVYIVAAWRSGCGK